MISRARARTLRKRVADFVNGLNTGRVGEYRYSVTGEPNLYASCYALMTLHYVNELPQDPAWRSAWADYILSFQDPATGQFLGPELRRPLPAGAKHDFEHLAMHLATTVLPCLDILGTKPRHSLQFAHRFLDSQTLAQWLAQRDWTDAWLEGNNLLFVLQLLIYLRDDECQPAAAARIDEFFAWLDANIDAATGLWGTNGYCSNFVAMCGGYHQLLAYYSEGRALTSPERLIDVTLALQHADGGFNPQGGGGACEDVDAVDILVNLYKRHDYKRPLIRMSLRAALRSILKKQMSDGGFVYRLDEPFAHMGMDATRTPPNNSNLFATWFRLHTIALISEALAEATLADFDWRFNPRMSMGWHDKDIRVSAAPWYRKLVEEFKFDPRRFIVSRLDSDLRRKIRRLVPYR